MTGERIVSEAFVLLPISDALKPVAKFMTSLKQVTSEVLPKGRGTNNTCLNPILGAALRVSPISRSPIGEEVATEKSLMV